MPLSPPVYGNLSRQNFVDLIVNWNSGKLLQTLGSLAQRSYPLRFTKGDTFRGTIRLVSETGASNPATNRLSCTADVIRLSDGISVVYADATHIEQITEPPSNGTSPTHVAFTLDVVGANIDAAFAATPDAFITAYSEARIQVLPLTEGTPGITTQDVIILREQCQIYKTSIAP